MLSYPLRQCFVQEAWGLDKSECSRCLQHCSVSKSSATLLPEPFGSYTDIFQALGKQTATVVHKPLGKRIGHK